MTKGPNHVFAPVYACVSVNGLYACCRYYCKILQTVVSVAVIVNVVFIPALMMKVIVCLRRFDQVHITITLFVHTCAHMPFV